MKRAVIASLGTAVVTAAAVGCSGGGESPAAASGTTTVASSTAASTHNATTPTATSSSPPNTSSSVAPTSSSPMVGGMTECTKEALAQPATEAAQALGSKNLYTVDVLQCADGWAVTSGVLSSTDNPGMGAPTSFIFEQEGQFWVPKEKAAVCGTDPVTTTPPADAQIPADLFVAGCAAG